MRDPIQNNARKDIFTIHGVDIKPKELFTEEKREDFSNFTIHVVDIKRAKSGLTRLLFNDFTIHVVDIKLLS